MNFTTILTRKNKAMLSGSKLRVLALILITTLMFGCWITANSTEFKQMEEELEFVSLMAYQLWADKKNLQKKIDQLSQTSLSLGSKFKNFKPAKKTVKPDDKKGPPESSKRKLFILRMKLMNFQLRYDRFPESIQELKEVVDQVPVEDRSESNVVHLERNNKGGWVFDPDTGTLEINTYSK